MVKPRPNKPICKIFLKPSKHISNPVYVVGGESSQRHTKAVLFEKTNQVADQRAVPHHNCRGLVDV